MADPVPRVWTSERKLLILIFALFFQARMIDNGHAVIPVPEAINLRDFNGDPNADPIESPRQHNMWERIRKILRNRYRPAGQSLPTTATTPTGGTGNSEDRSSNPNHHQTPTTVEAWKRKEKKNPTKKLKKKNWKEKERAWKKAFLKNCFCNSNCDSFLYLCTCNTTTSPYAPMPPYTCPPFSRLFLKRPGPPYPPKGC